jgi:hypothetical protein
MTSITWAEQIESARDEQRRNMGFGPFLVHIGCLATPMELIIRETGDGASWPVAPAPGWLKHRLEDASTTEMWCGHGGEWIFQPQSDGKRRRVHIPNSCDAKRRAMISNMLIQRPPLQLIAGGEAFSFCDSLFVIPEQSFELNSFRYHTPDREPLIVFIGYRGHTRPYSEVVTPGIYRAQNQPNAASVSRYEDLARISENVVKQAFFERQNRILSKVQARGVLQHYGIIGATDVLDLTYDVNVAKWFASNVWDSDKRSYRTKTFVEHDDADKAYDECSIVYTVLARAIGTLVEEQLANELMAFEHTTLVPWEGHRLEHVANDKLVQMPPQNLSPLVSPRAHLQSGFGLIGIGAQESDKWGSVLGIFEHCFHPTFAPEGWDRIGGASIVLGNTCYNWDEVTDHLQELTLPEDDECIGWIRKQVADLRNRFKL